MAIKYQSPYFNPSALSKHNIDRLALEEIPQGSTVLDVGCATGFMGKYLRKEKNCVVFGLDLRADEIKLAKKNLDSAFQGSIEDKTIIETILEKNNKKKFDIILATSLIEHTLEPDRVIVQMKKLLKPKGKIVMSTPNIAHWSMRLNLLKGNFNYTDYGILDRTHTHLFTRETFKNLFKRNNLKIIKEKIDAEGGGFPRLSLALAPFFPSLFAYQILLVAKK
jgi:methionine biosynthesis protein MetW